MNLSSLFRRTVTFPSAPGQSGPGETPATGALTLADLNLLQVPLSWPEAVAVVLEFLDRVPAQAPLPDPAVVALSPIGELRAFSRATLSGSPVKQSAELLRRLIGDATAPAALRELIDQNGGEPPTHTSVPDFAHALAYFERPNRRAEVAAVYARARTIFDKAAADEELERLRARAVHDLKAPSAGVSTGWRWPTRQQVLHGAFVAGLCVVIAASSVALVRVAVAPVPSRADAATPPLEVEVPLIARTPASIAAAAKNPSEMVGAASASIRKLIDRGLEATGLSKTGPAPEPESATAETPTSARRSRRRAAQSATNASQADAPAAPGAGGNLARGQWTVSVQEVTSPAGLAEFVAVSTGEADEGDTPVYTRADAEVDPAVLVRPQMPSVPEELDDSDGASVFDLLIDQYGHVEQVRLVSPANRFRDRILVSAAKAWQFQPATRDGQPVRYRLRLRITP
jgi:hypothetical protein